MDAIKGIFESFKTRLHALFDKSALVLIAPALIALFLIDGSIARTLVQWSLYALVLAGVGIIVSRVTFPQIKLGDLIDDAHRLGNIASAIIASSVIFFVGIVLMAMVLWAKA